MAFYSERRHALREGETAENKVSTAEDQVSVLIRVRSGRNDSAIPNCGRHGASTVSIFDDC
jgi:hypothetical protein